MSEFDLRVNREGLASLKHEFTPPQIRAQDIEAFNAAEMDFSTAPCVKKALHEMIDRGIFGFTVLTRTAQGGGLTLDSVDKASDAYAQGLRAGDVLIAANGQSLNAVEDLVRLKQSLGAGDAVSLTYVRDGQSYTASVALIDPDD